MITTTTYRERVDGRRDLLAAYSALDHSTTAELTQAQVDTEYARLLARLSVLLYLHGPTVPDAFLTALDNGGDVDPVDIAAAFLEAGGPPYTSVTASELQQELVHFSRIVDLGALGLADMPDAQRAARRLRNSHRLPTGLKVLSELIIVARSRILARGGQLRLPRLRGNPAQRHETGGSTTVWHGGDFALVVSSPRRRTRNQIGYLVTALLEYLTPVEATLAVWAHAVERPSRVDIEVTLAEIDNRGGLASVSWTSPGRDAPGPTPENPVVWCLRCLPVCVSGTGTPPALEKHGVELRVDDHQDGQVTLAVADGSNGERRLCLHAVKDRNAFSLAKMTERAGDLLDTYDGAAIVSIECGHIHLDRELDIDQEVGAMLGAHARRLLTARQAQQPVLTPMMDDDHVLVRLRPGDYRAFLTSQFGATDMHLVAESSPIVRAIVTAMWRRLHDRGLASRMRERGHNLFLHLDDGGEFCELFENYRLPDGGVGPAATGCVFFESALLVYRTAPATFDAYFRDRFDVDVHEEIARILDGPTGHDANVGRLEEFYARFDAVTAPHAPDPDVLALVDDVLTTAGHGVAHLNVLEDYYEVQQGKVRALLRLLGLPLRLVTLHFNVQTGRLVLND